MARYRDPIIARLAQLLTDEGPKELAGRYYHGDPVRVPGKSYLPAVFISKDDTTVGTVTNAEDETTTNLVINVVYDLSRDFSQAFDAISSSATLYDLIEGRGDDYTLKPASLVYVLRAHEQLDPNLWMNLEEPMAVEYGVGIEKRGEGIYTAEAVLRVQVKHHQLRPGLGA